MTRIQFNRSLSEINRWDYKLSWSQCFAVCVPVLIAGMALGFAAACLMQ